MSATTSACPPAPQTTSFLAMFFGESDTAGVLSVLDDGMHGAGHFAAAFEGDELDKDGDAGDGAAELRDEIATGLHGAAGGEEIIDDQDALAGDDRVGVHL